MRKKVILSQVLSVTLKRIFGILLHHSLCSAHEVRVITSHEIVTLAFVIGRAARLVAVARVRQNPRPVRALEVTAVAVIIIAVPAPFTLSGNGSPRPRPDDRTDCRTATSAECATEEGPSASPDYGAAKYILSRRLMNRHHQMPNPTSPRFPNFEAFCHSPFCGRGLLAPTLRQVNGGNRQPASETREYRAPGAVLLLADSTIAGCLVVRKLADS